MLFILPYNAASASAKSLAEGLGVRRIRRTNSKFVGSPDKTVVNWGNASVSAEVAKCKILNSPEAVNLCSNKLSFFKHVKENSDTCIPDFTESLEEARGWADQGFMVVAREALRGSGGAGIQLATLPEHVVNAPLYTKYVNKRDEYRVHILFGEVKTIQRKALPKDMAGGDVNWKIRNHANGFVFVRNEDRPIPEAVKAEAMKAYNSIPGLDFCSVDVIWNQHRGMAYVLEVNTASGLVGSTLDEYVEAFKKFK
jgi:glutathione synthase/RimK-type ligase-like ATP-grasp enzyme